MAPARAVKIDLLRRIVSGGDVAIEELPDRRALSRAERLAWRRLSHWVDDGDIRARDDQYARMQLTNVADALADLEAIEAGYLPEEVCRGEHLGTRLSAAGCFSVAVMTSVILYLIIRSA